MKLRFLAIFFLSLFTFSAQAQPKGLVEPVKWTITFNHESGSEEAEIIFKAQVDRGWHIYSQRMPGNGVEFTFEEQEGYSLVDTTMEGEAIIHFDEMLGLEIYSFKGAPEFVQKIKLNNPSDFEIAGSIMSFACDIIACLPPDFKDFIITQDGVQEVDLGIGSEIDCEKNPYDICNVDIDNPVKPCGEERQNDKSLWGVFLLGMLGGLIALVTPCVFPMIPLTVTFFTKGDEDKGKAIWRAATYGFFIMLIYFLLSVPFLVAPDVDPEILSMISTNPWLNIGLFVIIIVFALSFFGYYELVLPQKWANKMDSASDVGGLIGTFFMALTLAIVSFSCTGPILGSLLAGTLASQGADSVSIAGMHFQMVSVKLSMGMTGFGFALGLPFAVFAAFPSMLTKLPQSGGWLNSVKVVLGFLEVAFAIKFLSNADLVEQWGASKKRNILYCVVYFKCCSGLVCNWKN